MSARGGTFTSSTAVLPGFEPTFEFQPVDPLPVEEFQERLRRLRRDATIGEFDALIVHADPVGWFHTSNSFLRYVCDWMREGVLVIPTDSDLPATLLTFYGPEVLFPPPGEPTWVEDVRQVGTWGREKYARPGHAVAKVTEACAEILQRELRLAGGRFAVLGDRTSEPYVRALAGLLPGGAFENQTDLILRMQRVRSAREQTLVRAAAQLIDIGVQAVHHVASAGITDHELYAAFTYAQLARGGETGDAYQIGVNEFGTQIGKPYGRRLRAGDIVNLYLSRVTYRGYDAQAARMLLVGDVTQEQERLIDTCLESVERAMALARPGVSVRELSDESFAPFVERGYLTSADARTMRYSLEAGPDGRPTAFPRRRVGDADWEAQGRTLDHVYPAGAGPIGPSLGHSVSMGGMRGYTVSSTNEDLLEPGMTLVVHAQWLEPGRAGCNVGNCLLITENGVENLNSHTELAPYRVPVRP